MTMRSPTTVSAVPPTGKAKDRARPAQADAFADLQLARLSSLEPDESNDVALPLLTCFAFTEGPLHGGITLAGLTRRQHNVVHALLDSGHSSAGRVREGGRPAAGS